MCKMQLFMATVFAVLIFAGCATSTVVQPAPVPVDKVVKEKDTISTEEAAKLIGNKKITIAQKIQNYKMIKEKYKIMTGRGYIYSVTGSGNYYSAFICTDSKEECAVFKKKNIQIQVNLSNIPKATALYWNKGDVIEFSGEITNARKMGSRIVNLKYLNARKVE